MSLKIREVTEPLELGEGPHWDSREKVLYSVNILQKTIHKYDPATGINTSTKLDGEVSFIIPVEGVPDQFVMGVESKFLVIQWDGKDGSSAKVVKELAEIDKGQIDNVTYKMRINDGKVDPRGRLFAGTMYFHPPDVTKVGSIYRLVGEKMTKVEQGITVANGLSWDLNEKAFYYTDSMEYKIRRYDYDVETGDISNLRYIFDLKENGIEGIPDGHTIDTDGNLWVAVFGGSCILQVDPRNGQLLRKVPIPARLVTSATFGGPNLDILYVTSASVNIPNFEGEQKYPSGCIFEVTGLGVKGHPNYNFKL